MSEQRQEAADIEQRYVAEQNEVEEIVEGLDPAKSREDQTVDQVEAVGDEVEPEVERMADRDR